MANSQNFIFGSLAMILAFIFVLPSVATSWPFGMISQGMSYMAVFFHEIGHTIFAWIYGIPAFPIFDFKHGGGYSVQIAERSWFAQIAIWGLSAYGLYNFKDRLHVFALYGLSIFSFSLVSSALPIIMKTLFYLWGMALSQFLADLCWRGAFTVSF
jgi:hypothetical protein